jgi:hypothetical protein
VLAVRLCENAERIKTGTNRGQLLRALEKGQVGGGCVCVEGRRHECWVVPGGSEAPALVRSAGFSNSLLSPLRPLLLSAVLAGAAGAARRRRAARVGGRQRALPGRTQHVRGASALGQGGLGMPGSGWRARARPPTVHSAQPLACPRLPPPAPTHPRQARRRQVCGAAAAGQDHPAARRRAPRRRRPALPGAWRGAAAAWAAG